MNKVDNISGKKIAVKNIFAKIPTFLPAAVCEDVNPPFQFLVV
jgi:hypothetical protein